MARRNQHFIPVRVTKTDAEMPEHALIGDLGWFEAMRD